MVTEYNSGKTANVFRFQKHDKNGFINLGKPLYNFGVKAFVTESVMGKGKKSLPTTAVGN